MYIFKILLISLCFTQILDAKTVEMAKWKDAKSSAVSVTIDDNHTRDHKYWSHLSSHYNYRFTWFVITGLVGDERVKNNHDQWWRWQALIDAGHDIQSHSAYHFHPGYHPQRRLLSPKEEYFSSKDTMVKNLSLDYSQLISFAYPNGLNQQNSKDEARRHYAFARGAVGGLNLYGETDFLNIKSSSDAKNFSYRLIDRLIHNEGWYVALFHNMREPSVRTNAERLLNFVKSRQEDIWLGTFTEVAKYMKSVSSTKITIEEETENRIKFSILNNLNKKVFNRPVTMIVNRPDRPQSIVQNRTSKKWIMKSVKGKLSLVFDVALDQGEVVITY